MPKNGATTIWEAWEGPNSTQGGSGSLNHYSKGAMVEWLFSTMCGIRVDGDNHFAIAPKPGGHFTHAEASYVSVFGRVESKWNEKTAKRPTRSKSPQTAKRQSGCPPAEWKRSSPDCTGTRRKQSLRQEHERHLNRTVMRQDWAADAALRKNCFGKGIVAFSQV